MRPQLSPPVQQLVTVGEDSSGVLLEMLVLPASEIVEPSFFCETTRQSHLEQYRGLGSDAGGRRHSHYHL
jgi:hypothetical protein